MGEVREKMLEDLRLLGRAPKTREVYLASAKGFIAYHRRPPEEMGAAEVREYLLHLEAKGLSASSPSVPLWRHVGEAGGRERHPRPDEDAAAGARCAHRRRGRAGVRRHQVGEVPRDGHAGLRQRSPDHRALFVGGRRHRQRAHGHSCSTRQGPAGAVCDAAAACAEPSADLLAC